MTARKIKSDSEYISPYRLVRQLVEAAGNPPHLIEKVKELDMAISRDKRKIRGLKIYLTKIQKNK